MKNQSVSRCSICHDVIQTQHVFAENDQVYLKENNKNKKQSDSARDEWFPINFQWIPILQLHRKLKH